VLALLVALLLFGTGIAADDKGTWLMETAPIFLAAPVLVLTYRRFPLSSLLYGLIALHAVILMVGGLYTYARVPLGFWIQDLWHMSRNPYDKIGHFAQGFVPALVARELFLRRGIVPSRGWALTLALAVAMAISACYELIEWGAAMAMGGGADAFLGTQGDIWDTQSDMGMALVGASVAMLLFTRWQDRDIARLGG
jgi:putative membrane protein